MAKIKKKVTRYTKKLRKLSKKPFFAKAYLVASLSVLLITTLYWALLSAQIHAFNADQLVDVYLFEHGDTFSEAVFPDQHTFLLKWPIFLLVKLLGSTSLTFLLTTVGLTLLTVAGLVYLMYRIERRPLVLGTLCFALASTLLLVPVQPYPGALLPVNMAMLTTRNLEYIVFIISLIFIARSVTWRSSKFIAACLLMALLIASDKLFLSISIGGALLAIASYGLVRKRSMLRLAVIWLAASFIAAILAIATVRLISILGITGIGESGGAAGPYGIVHSLENLARGIIYLILGLLTNLGASPVIDTRLLSTFPNQIATQLLSLGGVGFIINMVITVAGLYSVGYLFIKSMRPDGLKKKKQLTKASRLHDESLKLSMLLVWSTVAAGGAFVVSNHYYPVDARYVALVLFTLFICLATLAKNYRFRRPEYLVATGAVILVGIFCSLGVVQSGYTGEKVALMETNTRNDRILKVLKHHPVDVLVGDYWRVLPAKLESKTPLTVMPMASCTQARDVLSSQSWQPDLRQHSFAYVLTFDPSLTGYAPCSLEQVTSKYGQPNASVVLDGTIKEPKELLLFYDNGSNKSVSKTVTHTLATVSPTTIEKIPYTACNDVTTMNIIAHQDDDLLFMNPDLRHDIDAGRCVHTVYVTSGDAGTDKYYWLGREKGSEFAYANMAGLAADTIWIERIVKLPDGQFISIASPKGNMKLSLIFMHLPDGNVHGEGFESTHHESLARLEAGQVPVLHTSDHQSVYSSKQVIQTLKLLMQTYQPNVVRTQANVVNHHYPDHSDHMAVGRYTSQAYQAYTADPSMSIASQMIFYIGYPIHSLPPNVTGEDLTRKQRTFFDYAHFDDGVCGSVAQCAQGSVYNTYLNRQYTSDY